MRDRVKGRPPSVVCCSVNSISGGCLSTGGYIDAAVLGMDEASLMPGDEPSAELEAPPRGWGGGGGGGQEAFANRG